jgi:hypothetical protein
MLRWWCNYQNYEIKHMCIKLVIRNWSIGDISFCVIKTNLMHNLSSVYFVSQPLHVSGIFVVCCLYTTIGTCRSFQLTVCWPGWNGTDVSRCTVNKTLKNISFSKKRRHFFIIWATSSVKKLHNEKLYDLYCSPSNFRWSNREDCDEREM